MKNLSPVPSRNAALPLSVLVVDDNVPAAKTLGWTVEMFGHEVRLAHSGASALELARTLRPDVVLLDIGLPDMDGCEVCMAMHREPALKHTVFIAQTGWGLPEHKERSRNAGFDHHMVKPIDMYVLKELLETVAASRGTDATPA